jgi:hypothetical protein
MKMLNLFNQLHQRNKLLSVTGWVHVILLLIFLLLMPFDNRLVTGVNPWIKPAKFALSIGIFSWTMAWILFYFRDKPRRIRIYSLLFAVTLYVEMAIIGIQAARGTTSHFNVFSSPPNAILFSVMGIFITINLIVTIVLFIDFFRQKTTLSPSMLWAIRLGLFVMILGSLEGFVMIKLFSHTVGAADGGPGLPVVKWSTVAGDLRIAHFLGMHGLQIFPLLAYFLSRKYVQVPAWVKTSAVMCFAVLYLLLMNFTLWQALNKMPLIRMGTASEVVVKK